MTGNKVTYLPAKEGRERFPEIPGDSFRHSVQLVRPDGEVHHGARAVFETVWKTPHHSWLLWAYQHIPGFAGVTELAYRFISAHRDFAYSATRFAFGRKVLPASYERIEWLFLRMLAIIYLIAFVSFGVQVDGLIGSNGILPLGRYLGAVEQALGTAAYWSAPTIFWVSHADWFLKAVCCAGAGVSIVLLLGFAQRPALCVLFALYLSLCTAGQDFMSFQWDMLLLEAGFLAIFLGTSRIVIWLFRLLLFRLMFLSGAVKLLSHDPEWRSFTALRFHYWTQPLPTPFAWYMAQLPDWAQRASTVATLLIELVIPFLIFAPRRIRHFGAWCILLLQVMIFLTGNYTFFNLLTMALCLFLFEDQRLPHFDISRFRLRPRRRLGIAVAVVVVLLGLLQLMSALLGYVPGAASEILQTTAPFGIVNTYGLFAVMTTSRPEIIVQGSNDGVSWKDYEFKYKAGELTRAPQWNAPHQPRLDWQMWFAALGSFRNNPWFVNFAVRLLEGSRPVLALLRENPFPNAPPKYVRALMYQYRFTDWETKKRTGMWWARQPNGFYLPPISLEDIRRSD